LLSVSVTVSVTVFGKATDAAGLTAARKAGLLEGISRRCRA
jgi:hypothetical protein